MIDRIISFIIKITGVLLFYGQLKINIVSCSIYVHYIRKRGNCTWLSKCSPRGQGSVLVAIHGSPPHRMTFGNTGPILAAKPCPMGTGFGCQNWTWDHFWDYLWQPKVVKWSQGGQIWMWYIFA